MKIKKHLFTLLLTMTLIFATTITALAATKTVYMNLADARAKITGIVVWETKVLVKDKGTGGIVVDNISNDPEMADIVDRLELEIKAYNNGKVKNKKTVTDSACFDIEGVVTAYADEFKFNGKMENNGKTITDTVWIWK